MNLVNLVFQGGKDDKSTPLFVADRLSRIISEQGVDSLPEFTTSTRLLPSVLVDSDIAMLEDNVVNDLMQTMAGIYAAHYMQAVSISLNVDGIDTIRLLDQFATDRSPIRNTVRGERGAIRDLFSSAMESMDLPDFGMEEGAGGKVEASAGKGFGDGSNLAVGRLLHVKVGAGDRAITIPVQLMLQPRIIPSNIIPKTLALIDSDNSFGARYHKWRSGEIESFADFLFALDIIEADRKLMLSDGGDVYRDASARRTRAMSDRLLSAGEKSFNTASTMAVITKNAAESLELALKGKLKHAKVRDRYFHDTHSMMLVVVDPRMERVTIYQRGIDGHGTYTYNDIKNNGSKSDGLNIDSILKAYKLGESPSL